MSLIRFQIGFDIHGDMQDTAAGMVFFEFAADFKPQIRICGGDLFDFRPLRKGASDDERRQSLKADFDAGKRWFNKFRPTVFLRGNHDERIYELADHGSGVAQDYAYEGVQEIRHLVEHHKCQMLPYHKRLGVYRLGNVSVIHGFSAGIYAARSHALVYGNCMFGHVHYNDTHPIAGIERRAGRAVGCLCSLNMEYNARQMGTLRQNHGFAFGVTNSKTGETFVQTVEPVDGKWIIPATFKTYA